ncbi:copper amine oxidase N-terminal domain-containing protein [Paenibacillus sp. R14(2021)]|uniref:copper amine oxidase N-terminal domain-containing protein n=1 Tax=Paenibacillus sp. R14(2021) TaxID=2859228 RepID=UPI001C613675|nr:copper amine oxidase N-terminal domain-containing protein [Paenibacillus sp. R14(2021)]
MNSSRKFRRLAIYGIAGTMLLTSGMPAATAAPQAAAAAPAAAPISVILDRQPLKLAVPPVIIRGNLMFPAKAVFDALGIRFQMGAGGLVAVNGSTRVEGKLNSNKAVKGKQTFQLSSAPVIQDGRTYVAAKFVSLVLDKDVFYNSAKKQVTIGYTEAQMAGFQRLLFEAARSGDVATLEVMISRGVDVNKKLFSIFLDNTALDYAILFDHADAARVLLEHGATYDHQRVFQVLLHRNERLMDVLLAHGLNPNMPLDNLSGSLLAVACGNIWSMNPDNSVTIIHPSVPIVTLLLDHGGDPSQDNSLSNAVQASSYEVIQLLLQHGAEPYRKDSLGNTPYEKARWGGISSWLTLGANPNIPHLSILDAKGKIITDGSISLQAVNQTDFNTYFYRWSGETAYLEVPDGDYKLLNVARWGSSYLFADTVIHIEQGKTTEPAIQLPEANVTFTIDNAGADQKSGFIDVQNEKGTMSTGVEVADGQFGLSLPPGTYKLGRYRLQQTEYELIGDTTITVSEDGEQQKLTVNIP